VWVGAVSSDGRFDSVAGRSDLTFGGSGLWGAILQPLTLGQDLRRPRLCFPSTVVSRALEAGAYYFFNKMAPLPCGFDIAATPWDPSTSRFNNLRRRLQPYPSVVGVLLQQRLHRPTLNRCSVRDRHLGVSVALFV
jgi:hypothetical protein